MQGYDAATLQALVELKAQELGQLDNPAARLNTANWPLMIGPQRWHRYDQPEYIWQPTSEIPKYNFVLLASGNASIMSAAADR